MKNPNTYSYTNLSSGMLCRTGLQHFWWFPLALDKYFFFLNRFNRCSTEQDTDIVDLTPPFITSTSCFNSLFLTTIFILTTPPTSSVHETTPTPPFPFGLTILLSNTPFANLFFFCFWWPFNNSYPLLNEAAFNSILLKLQFCMWIYVTSYKLAI